MIRRTFLKGIFATVAIVATGKLVAASEMLGNIYELDVHKAKKFNAVEYRGEWKWRNPEYQSLGTEGFYRAEFSQGISPVNPAYGICVMHRPETFWEKIGRYFYRDRGVRL